MRAVEILQTGAKLVSGDRAKTYGDKTHNHTNIANLWTAYLQNADLLKSDRMLKPDQVCVMLALLKIARTQLGEGTVDSWVDATAYLGLAGEISDDG